MRLGVQARFVALAFALGIVVLAALFGIRNQQRAHQAAVGAAVQAMLDGADAGGDSETRQGAIGARIEAADRHERVMVLLDLLVLAGAFAAAGWLVWSGLVQPVGRLADAVRRIEDGEEADVLDDGDRDDEFGDLTRSFATIGDALAAMRQRIDHDAASPPPSPLPPVAAHSTQVFSPGPAQHLAPRPDSAPEVPARAVPVAAPPAPPPPVAIDPAVAQQQAMRRARLEDDLREAWQRGEMSVLYQPIHALVDGSMRGAEALLRWQHPSEGAIGPDEFIPLAERTELIDALGRHVLVQACSDASLWPSGGTPETTPTLSVNVSAKQLLRPQLFESVVEALRRSGLAASRLHLEMPVAALRSDDPAVAATIEQLRGLGVRIWLDAVGTDVADQARWMRLSVDGVKVGRSRIAGRGDTAADEAAIVASARALRIVAVVVGVEELAQLNVLREQGAELAQGYVLCRPVDTAEIGRRLLS